MGWREVMDARVLLVALTAVTAWGLSYPAAWLAHALGAVDRPGPRRINLRPVPRLGGAAVFGAILCGAALELRWSTAPVAGAWLVMGLAATAVFLVGSIDDVCTLGAASRLIVEGAAALVVTAGFARFHLGSGTAGALAGVVVSAVWLVAVSNGGNLIDGLDGLAAGVALLEIAGLGVVAVAANRPVELGALLLAGGAWAGFWLRNRFPARIFAGDGGALLAGFGVAALALRTLDFAPGARGIEATILIMAYPLNEVLTTVCRRAWRALGNPSGPRHPSWSNLLAAVFVADSDHAHHRLLRRGWSHRAAVNLCCLLAAVMVLAGASIALWSASMWPATMVVLAAAAGFLRFLGYLHFDWLNGRPQLTTSVPVSRRRVL